MTVVARRLGACLAVLMIGLLSPGIARAAGSSTSLRTTSASVTRPCRAIATSTPPPRVILREIDLLAATHDVCARACTCRKRRLPVSVFSECTRRSRTPSRAATVAVR